MALDVLLQAIVDDGEAEARDILAAARAEAESVRAAADARAERRCVEAVAARDAELRAAFDAGRARALKESRSRVLRARGEFLERVFEAAEAELPGYLDHAALVDAPRRLCREALRYFTGGQVRIRCRSGLARRVSVEGVPVVPDESVAEGVIVEALDGSARVDNTLAARMHRRRAELSIAILAAAAETG